MMSSLTRREMLTAGTAVAAAATLVRPMNAEPAKKEPFALCLNTSTIRGQSLPIVQVVDIAARAGYTAIEPWIDELDKHVQSGGSLKDLAKRIGDAGLTVASAIGFAQWIVDDDAARKKGLEDAKHAMDKVAQIGGKFIAAPPAGAQNRNDISPAHIAERYRALLELGDTMGVVPQLEVWGFSKTLGKLSEAVAAAVATDHPKACVLADVYHLYKGGSGFHGIKLLGPLAMHCFHFNDYPATPARAEITDAQRVFPGDGIAPLKDLLHDLVAIGYHGVLSLELFNRDYWQKDALLIARTGLEKMRAVVKTVLE
jgi:2-keto-myo-inositol isomerase